MARERRVLALSSLVVLGILSGGCSGGDGDAVRAGAVGPTSSTRATADGTTLTVVRDGGDGECDPATVELTASNPTWPHDVTTTAEVTGRPGASHAVVLRMLPTPEGTVALVAAGRDVDSVLLAVGDATDEVDPDVLAAVAVRGTGRPALQWTASNASEATSDPGSGRFVSSRC